MPARTRYARSGDYHIAYQVVGAGPLDLVLVPGFVSNVEVAWDWPEYRRFVERLASFSRVIAFDKRGTGGSDRSVGVPTLEERMDDLRAVMDAVGSERAAFAGISEGGAMSILFAATYPERARALVLLGSFARFSRSADYPWGYSDEQLDRLQAGILESWGSGRDVEFFAPSLAGDEGTRRQWGRLCRQAASPREAAAIIRMNQKIDVRPILESLHLPTLVVHRTLDRVILAGAGRYMADRIEGAQLLELPGGDHLPFLGDTGPLLDGIQEFLTGSRPAAVEPDRVLATVLFTDIVDSTQRAVELGDRRWRELLSTHHERVRHELERYRGREVDTAGDGFFATFDGPARAIHCARDIVRSVGELGVRLRAGLHTGECELHESGVAGIAVHIGARVAGLADPGQVLVSSTVRDLVAGSGIDFQERGLHALKGIPGEWRLYQVASEAS